MPSLAGQPCVSAIKHCFQKVISYTMPTCSSNCALQQAMYTRDEGHVEQSRTCTQPTYRNSRVIRSRPNKRTRDFRTPTSFFLSPPSSNPEHKKNRPEVGKNSQARCTVIYLLLPGTSMTTGDSCPEKLLQLPNPGSHQEIAPAYALF